MKIKSYVVALKPEWSFREPGDLPRNMLRVLAYAAQLTARGDLLLLNKDGSPLRMFAAGVWATFVDDGHDVLDDERSKMAAEQRRFCEERHEKERKKSNHADDCVYETTARWIEAKQGSTRAVRMHFVSHWERVDDETYP